jgi:hypothetical protein
MAKGMVVNYECELCGTEVVVTSEGESRLSPIYCCGVEVTEVSSAEKKSRKSERKAAKKKATRKKPVAKKKKSKR